MAKQLRYHLQAYVYNCKQPVLEEECATKREAHEVADEILGDLLAAAEIGPEVRVTDRRTGRVRIARPITSGIRWS